MQRKFSISNSSFTKKVIWESNEKIQRIHKAAQHGNIGVNILIKDLKIIQFRYHSVLDLGQQNIICWFKNIMSCTITVFIHRISSLTPGSFLLLPSPASPHHLNMCELLSNALRTQTKAALCSSWNIKMLTASFFKENILYLLI